ncbi:MAG TPA: Hsp20 family protein [Devosiaceae bacterium]|nr:Hsp20 family protein [Devosiaceae bacterium]
MERNCSAGWVSIGRGGFLLCAKRRADSETNRREFIIHERQFDRLERFVQLPPGIDPGAATAALSNGILTVIIPKTNEARADSKPIPVQRG